MNIEQLIVALASAAAVAALILVAFGLGFRAKPTLESEDAVRARLAEAEPDASPSDILIAKDGAAAIVRLADGRIAVLRAVGDRFAIRVFPRDALAVAAVAEGLRITFADLGFPALKLRVEAAPSWLAPH
ncbi:MAG: hypothetical protein JNJ73_09220 [Hyphomonadaceae bacterium]|nr:hypothetical protein [Hyphomonadaceae bacterium]